MSSIEPTATEPLAGVRVLDLSRVLAGPVVGRLLADLGADVVKVEPPQEDLSRYIAPKDDRGISGLYTLANVGKRNVCIDLTQSEGREVVIDLARWADVMIENFRPGVLENLGVGWPELQRANPRLVLLSINGYGSDGPARARPAYAPVIHAVSGVLQYQSEWTGLPLSPLADNQGDMVTALHGTIGLLAALRAAEASGEGQHLEVPLFDALLATYSETPFVLLDEPRHRDECPLYDAGPHGIIAVAGPPQNAWHQLRTTHHLEDPAPRGADIPTKARLRQGAIEAWMTGHENLDAVLAGLEQAGLAGGRVEPLREVLLGPLATQRNLLIQVDDRRGGTRPVVRSPYRFSGVTCPIRRPPPHRGEHNREVLAEVLGYTDDRIVALEAAGTILTPERDPSE